MKKLTRRRKEILTVALVRERKGRTLAQPRNHSELQAFEALIQEGYGLWETQGQGVVFQLTSRGRIVAKGLRQD